MSKMRVWHIPQVPMKAFNVPVETVEEAKKIMDIFAAYDLFQLENKIKPDFTNNSGLEVFDDESQEWKDWDLQNEDDYYDNIDIYLEDNEEVRKFSEELFSQLDGDWNED